MATHQAINSIGVKIYNGYWYKGFPWSLHLHKSFEFVFVEKGSLKATVGKDEYTVSEGTALLIYPYELHSFSADTDTLYFVAVFSIDLCESFYNHTQNFSPDTRLFAPEKATVDYLKNHIMIPMDDFGEFIKVPDAPFFYIKSCLYAICADFTKSVNFTGRARNTQLINEILNYIEESFHENITLKSLSDAISYDYHYISRLFNETFGISFKVLVNQYRCEKAAILLMTTRRTVVDIALACGFQSVRSFNRVFSEYSSLTPSDYRKKSL